MTLANAKKIKGKSFISDLKSRPPIDPQRLTELVQRLRNHDMSVSEEIIGGHIGLCCQIVGRYLWRTPIEAKELLSEALYALTRCIKEMAPKNLRDNNITPYIVATLHSKLSEFIGNNRLIGVPNTTYRRYNGYIKPPKVERTLPLEKSKESFLKMLELRDLLNAACENSLDRAIVKMRENGSTDAEIAPVLGVSRTRITRQRAEIERRFKELQDEANA